MGRLIEDLRDATHIDQGTLALKVAEVDLQAAIRSTVELHSDISQARGQTVSVVLPDVTISVRAGPTPARRASAAAAGQLRSNDLTAKQIEEAIKSSRPSLARIRAATTA